ncbi:MAG: undecaprenyl diphosphate synthase [Myxococcota bacterium]|jgi:undecaprenyl diphosphate synthase
MSESRINPDRLPRHVAIIMDGNGRWAQSRGLERNRGHREGIESVRAIVREAGNLDLDFLTLYAFSMENWNRPKLEVGALMALLEEYLDVELPEIMEKEIRIRVVGRIDRLPWTTRRAVKFAVDKTAKNRGLTIVFALSYGARQEIVDAAKALMRDAEAGKLDPERLDEKTFSAYLYAPDLPDPDLLIRTGGDSRVSNFLLWQIAYSEIYTTDLMWPEFREANFIDAIVEYQSRERRFGLTSAQVSTDGGTETA